AGQPVFGGQRFEFTFEIFLLRHVARDGNDAVDRAADFSRHAQVRFEPDFFFLAMAGSVGDAGFLGFAWFEGGYEFGNPRQILRIDADQRGRPRQLFGPPAHDTDRRWRDVLN